MVATVGQPILKIKWKTNKPVWIYQWLLIEQKMLRIKELVAEQLSASHTVPSSSVWNTLVFTIPKKSRRWRLLHDLTAINTVMEEMGCSTARNAVTYNDP